jgi:hypothetical protein
MGSFYTNFSVKSVNAPAIQAALKKAKRSALITPAKRGWVVVYDEESESQDTGTIEQVAALLSKDQNCPVLAVLNHDDDILCYWLYQNGQQLDHYDSNPDYFGDGDGTDRGGDAELLCKTLGVPGAVETVRELLHEDEFTFAMELHAQLAEALKLPDCAISVGFNYAQEGELPDGLSMDDLLTSP